MKKDGQVTILNYLLPVVMIILGVRHLTKHGLDAWAVIPVVLGVVALYLALFNKFLLQQILNFLIKLWYPIGQIITVFLLTVTFYFVFMPVGLLLKLLKKDILNRDFKTDRLSYWLERPTGQKSNYTQQF